ncbi:unnamed protein product, partial [Timema podura]|nr:unnamed protein product [Timema podura]
VVTPIAQWLGSSNSCINPILYAFFNKKYRRGFVAIFKSRRCCGRLRYYESVMMSSSASLRKSSYYVNNNNSSTRRPAPGQDTSVSYIFNNTVHFRQTEVSLVTTHEPPLAIASIDLDIFWYQTYIKGENTFTTPVQDLKSELLSTCSPIYSESYVIDHAATDVSVENLNRWAYGPRRRSRLVCFAFDRNATSSLQGWSTPPPPLKLFSLLPPHKFGSVSLLQHLEEKDIVWLTTPAPVDLVSARLHSTNTSRHYPY